MTKRFTLLSDIETKKSELNLLIEEMLKVYPSAPRDNIGGFIVGKMADFEEGTDEYRECHVFWNRYCDITGNISRLSTQYTNDTRSRASHALN